MRHRTDLAVLFVLIAACAAHRAPARGNPPSPTLEDLLTPRSDPDVQAAVAATPSAGRPPKLVGRLKPELPEGAQPGSHPVQLEMVITAHGEAKVVGVTKSSGAPYDLSCARAAVRSRWEPGRTADGTPIAYQTKMVCSFRVD